MRRLWSEKAQTATVAAPFWVALAEAQAEVRLGDRRPVVADLRAHVDDVDVGPCPRNRIRD